MRQRVITAVLALLIFIPIMILGGFGFEVLVTLIGLITLQELLHMMDIKLFSLAGLLATVSMLSILLPSHYFDFLPEAINQLILYYASVVMMIFFMIYWPDKLNFDIIGKLSLSALYIGRGYHFLIETRNMGLVLLVYVLIIIWGNDSFAYFVGRLIGKTPLAPKISPNKTIEGSIGGIIGAFGLSSLYLVFFQVVDITIWQNLILVAFIGIIGQLGDLAESAIKRYYGVKDSGKILPGHGGMLDRFDNMLLTLPMFHFIISFF